MKLTDIYEGSDEGETVKNAPPPGDMGDLLTTAQAARELDVEMSRIRQLVANDELKSHQPEEGRRDHFFKKSDIEAYKSKDKDEGGRPKKVDDG